MIWHTTQIKSPSSKEFFLEEASLVDRKYFAEIKQTDSKVSSCVIISSPVSEREAC